VVVTIIIPVVALTVQVVMLVVAITPLFLSPLRLFCSVWDWLQGEFILSSGVRKAGSGYRVIYSPESHQDLCGLPCCRQAGATVRCKYVFIKRLGEMSNLAFLIFGCG